MSAQVGSGVRVETRAGSMLVQNSGEGVFAHFSEDELHAIRYALIEKRGRLDGDKWADPDYADFLSIIAMKIGSLVED